MKITHEIVLRYPDLDEAADAVVGIRRALLRFDLAAVGLLQVTLSISDIDLSISSVVTGTMLRDGKIDIGAEVAGDLLRAIAARSKT